MKRMTQRDRQEHENTVKVLFFILTRIGGKSKRVNINTEVLYDSRRYEKYDYDTAEPVQRTAETGSKG